MGSNVGLGMGGAGFKSLVGLPWTIRSTVGAVPGAGNEFSIAVPNGELWELLMFQYKFTTAVAAGNRVCNVRAISNGELSMQVGNPTYQVASLVRNYRWMTNFAVFINLVGGDTPPIEMQGPLPGKLILDSGDILATETGNQQAADAYTDINITYRRYENAARLSFL